MVHNKAGKWQSEAKQLMSTKKRTAKYYRRQQTELAP
jgi:hypothetical protein